MSFEIERVDGRRGVARFIDVSWQVNDPRGTPWVPPLRVVVKDLLDDRKNPFYRDAARQLFIARRNGRPVGRIAAIENRAHNRHHGDRVGFFGFFECVDDAEVAEGLLAAAQEWLAAKGLTAVRGPMNPSMNHECGMLVDGYDAHPMLMTPWNPPYHATLMEKAGYRKEKDLVAYYMAEGPDTDDERIAALGERVAKRTGLTFRDVDYKHFEGEARLIWSLYNEAWADNWGFVPPGWDEFEFTAHGLKEIMGKDFSFVAEANGEPVGFMLIAHDLNRVLQKMPSGRLWPWNIARLVVQTPRVMSGRIMLLGVKAQYRGRGIFPLLASEMIRRGRAVGGEGVEASWILEDNDALRDPLEALGYRPYRTWRIYRKDLLARP